MEDPMSADLNNANLHLDTLSISSINGVTYQIPPSIGSKSRLTLGNANGYDYRAILLKTSFTSAQNIQWSLASLLNSSVVIDSAYFTLHLELDTLINPVSISLYTFPNSGDSIFSETESNYLNFADNEMANGHYVTSAMEEEYKFSEDSLINSIFRLRFNIRDMLDSAFLDTALNYTIMLKQDESTDELHSYYSREYFSSNEFNPLFEVYYHEFTYPDSSDTSQITLVDTLRKTFNIVNDLSIMAPPEISFEDTSYISISRGKGLRSLISLEFLDTLNLPRQTTFDKAELTFYIVPDTNISLFTVYAVPLMDTVEINHFSIYDDDSFKSYNYLITSGIVSNNKVVLNIKHFLQDHYFDNVNNLGLKIYS